MNRNHQAESRFATITKIGALACLTFTVATVGLKHAVVDEATVLAIPTASVEAAPVATAKAPDTFYYFPSQYQLNPGAEPSEPVPTF